MTLQLVWFKRDLRWADHQPLIQALERGPVLPLYIVEPEYWRQPDASGRQWAFCREALIDLREGLAALGQPLVVRCGDAVEVLERARRQLGVEAVWSHEETGNDWTYARDRRVAAWAEEQGIPWREIPQFGVTRRMRSRRGWAQRWEARMGEPLTPSPRVLDASAGGVPWRPAGRNGSRTPGGPLPPSASRWPAPRPERTGGFHPASGAALLQLHL